MLVFVAAVLSQASSLVLVPLLIFFDIGEMSVVYGPPVQDVKKLVETELGKGEGPVSVRAPGVC